MAEEEGFEPPCEFPRKRFSRPPVSTTHPFLHVPSYLILTRPNSPQSALPGAQSVPRYPQQQPKHHDWNRRYHRVEENAAQERRLTLMPILQFGAIGNAYLIRMLQIPYEFAGMSVPVLRIALNGAIDDLLQLGRNARIDLARRHRIIQQPVVHDGECIGALEWRSSGQHLIKHHAHRIDVTATVAAFALDLLRRNIIRCPHDLRQLGKCEPPRSLFARDTEVDQFNAIIRIDHNVLGFKIAVYHAVRVDVFERIEHLDRDPHSPLR